MGLFNVIDSMIKVKQEREALQQSADQNGGYAAVDPTTGGKAFSNDPRALDPQGLPGGNSYFTDVLRQMQGRSTSTDAAKMGQPLAAGQDPQQLQQMMAMRALPMNQQKEKAGIADTEAQTEERQAISRRQAQLGANEKDPLWLEAAKLAQPKDFVSQLRWSQDPSYRDQMTNEMYNRMKNMKSGNVPATPGKAAPMPTGGGAPSAYKTPQDVLADLKAGKIKGGRDEAKKILIQNFPDQFH